MARLIDADAFEEYHCNGCPYRREGSCTKDDPICATIQDLKDFPTVDAVPVVRCKDCKHHKILTDYRGCTLPVCGRKKLNVEMHKDDFCSYGERRTDERKAD